MTNKYDEIDALIEIEYAKSQANALRTLGWIISFLVMGCFLARAM